MYKYVMLSHPSSLACSAPTGCSQPIPSLPTKYCHHHCHHRFYRGRNSTLPRSHQPDKLWETSAASPQPCWMVGSQEGQRQQTGPPVSLLLCPK